MTWPPHEITGDRAACPREMQSRDLTTSRDHGRLYLTLARRFDNVRQYSMVDFPPWWQVPTGLSASLASNMHLIEALARLQLTSLGKVASSVPIVYQGKRITLLKGPDALAARRDVASKLDHRAIAALRKPMHVDKPDWSLMQQLSDAGIGVCPASGMPVLHAACWGGHGWPPRSRYHHQARPCGQKAFREEDVLARA